MAKDVPKWWDKKQTENNNKTAILSFFWLDNKNDIKFLIKNIFKLFYCGNDHEKKLFNKKFWKNINFKVLMIYEIVFW